MAHTIQLERKKKVQLTFQKCKGLQETKQLYSNKKGQPRRNGHTFLEWLAFQD